MEDTIAYGAELRKYRRFRFSFLKGRKVRIPLQRELRLGAEFDVKLLNKSQPGLRNGKF